MNDLADIAARLDALESAVFPGPVSERTLEEKLREEWDRRAPEVGFDVSHFGDTVRVGHTLVTICGWSDGEVVVRRAGSSRLVKMAPMPVLEAIRHG